MIHGGLHLFGHLQELFGRFVVAPVEETDVVAHGFAEFGDGLEVPLYRRDDRGELNEREVGLFDVVVFGTPGVDVVDVGRVLGPEVHGVVGESVSHCCLLGVKMGTGYLLLGGTPFTVVPEESVRAYEVLVARILYPFLR